MRVTDEFGMRNSELMTGFARTHFIYVFAAANRRERCPQRSERIRNA